MAGICEALEAAMIAQQEEADKEDAARCRQSEEMSQAKAERRYGAMKIRRGALVTLMMARWR